MFRLSEREWSTIDLTQEENFLLREELAAIHKNVINGKSVPQHCGGVENETKNMDLLEEFARFFNYYFDPFTPVLKSHVVLAAASSHAIDGLLSSICERGDGVIVPVHLVEADMSGFFGNSTARLKSILAAAIDQSPCRIRALILTNPHKTLGRCFPQEVLEGCLELCQQRAIHLISDEEYALTEFSCAEVSAPAPFISVLSLNTRALKCDRSRVHTMWSIGKDFGASGFRLGCIVTQDNQMLASRLEASLYSRISTSSAVFTKTLLSSPTLPFLIALNSARLAEAYIYITDFFTRRNIRYVPVSTGLNIFARLAPEASTWVDEDAMIDRLREVGVLVTGGRQYHGGPQGKGWARLSFSVEPRKLHEALERIDLTLGKAMCSPT
ncbi:hypothetical protein DIZ76_013262 [Coccidioides immitis]|nr:hypothetical protein DIZ76_013262 [Coccidioides immitis]